YHNEPGGAAEKEYDLDPRGLLSGLYTSKDTPVDPPAVTDPKRTAGGWIPRLGRPKQLPPWLTQADLDYFVSQFEHAGFRGGVNYYRNFDRNWEITPQLTGARIKVPVAFIAGVDDIVIRGAKEDALRTTMSRVADDLRRVTLVPGAGHWVQQEKPQEVNAFVLDFLKGLKT
ncbi:MAG TPA: alpha/beta hydrolase, partial [Hyphomonadaceae bacterium]|nr:alpha/beta hydrolase [Hyphomonadaceae bacterium]